MFKRSGGGYMAVAQKREGGICVAAADVAQELGSRLGSRLGSERLQLLTAWQTDRQKIARQRRTRQQLGYGHIGPQSECTGRG